MTSQIRRSNESINSIENDRIRGSVFDRLSNKQMNSHQNQSHQIKNYHLHKKSSKYENMEFLNSKILNDNSKLNLDVKRKIAGQYSHNKINHENDLSPENVYYKSSKNINSEKSDKIACNIKHSNRHLLQNELIKDDIQNVKSSQLNEKSHKLYKETDTYKKHYHDQGAEILEKKRIQLTRKLQMIDQKDKKLISRHRNRQSTYKSPCSNSSHSICSSSRSSDTESYSGSSASCTNSSCSSSSYSDDDKLGNISNYRSKKNSFNHHRKYLKKILHEDITLEHNHLHKQQTPSISKTSKRYKIENHTPPSNNYQVNVSTRRIRSRSPQSTNSSYYSRKSHGLTPPIQLQHSASPSIASASHSVKTDNIKLDRHGNIRISLKEKERQRRIIETQQQSIPNSPSPYTSQNQIYSKSRSPISRNREDYFSSDEKPKYKDLNYYNNNESLTISPVNTLEYNQRKLQNYYNEDYQNRDYEEKNRRYDEKVYIYKSGSSFKQRDVLSTEYLEKNYNSSGNRNILHPKTPPLPKRKDYENKTKKYLNEDYNKHEITHSYNFSSEHIEKISENMPFSSIIEEPILTEISRYSNNNLISQNKQNNYNNYNNLNKYRSYNSNLQIYPKSPETNNVFLAKKSTNQPNKLNLNKLDLIKKENSKLIKLESKLKDHIDEISSISNNSLDDFDLLSNKSKSDENEKIENKDCIKFEQILPIKQFQQNKKDEQIEEKIDLQSKNEIQISIEEHNEENQINKDTKNEEIISDENFSEWSDIEDYDNLINNDELERKSDKFIYDIKFKVDDELEAISDDEFDAIIDEQELENEKKGILSCKKVLDQLDIDWESLKQTNEDQYHPMLSSSLKQFKPANLLAQIGISQKYAGNQLSQKIINYCREQLKNDNFNFESPIATYHYMYLKNRKKLEFLPRNFDLQTSLNNNSIENSSLELRKFLSNGNVFIRRSYNHLLNKLRKQVLQMKKEKFKINNTISKQNETQLLYFNEQECNEEKLSNDLIKKTNCQELNLKSTSYEKINLKICSEFK